MRRNEAPFAGQASNGAKDISANLDGADTVAPLVGKLLRMPNGSIELLPKILAHVMHSVAFTSSLTSAKCSSRCVSAPSHREKAELHAVTNTRSRFTSTSLCGSDWTRRICF